MTIRKTIRKFSVPMIEQSYKSDLEYIRPGCRVRFHGAEEALEGTVVEYEPSASRMVIAFDSVSGWVKGKYHYGQSYSLDCSREDLADVQWLGPPPNERPAFRIGVKGRRRVPTPSANPNRFRKFGR